MSNSRFLVQHAKRELTMRTFAEVDQTAGQYYFSSQRSGIDNRCRERMIRRCLPHVKPNGTVLELGFMDGQWTDHFLAKGCSVVAVEGALKNVEFGHNKYRSQPRVRMVRSLFDDYRPEEKFDLIHMGGMLKHLDNPGDLLRIAKGWLKPDGILTATTPNANSLHRRVGVHMGMLKDLTDLSETDNAVGNLRHYDLNSFRQLLETSGFNNFYFHYQAGVE
jgi:2-polyprenyl-3-methyl-5-hydroxy-6-metoxy-1,4-benzoquinol methylase